MEVNESPSRSIPKEHIKELVRLSLDVISVAQEKLGDTEFTPGGSADQDLERELFLRSGSRPNRIYRIDDAIGNRELNWGRIHINGFEFGEDGRVTRFTPLSLPRQTKDNKTWHLIRRSGVTNIDTTKSLIEDIQTGTEVSEDEWDKAVENWRAEQKAEADVYDKEHPDIDL